MPTGTIDPPLVVAEPSQHMPMAEHFALVGHGVPSRTEFVHDFSVEVSEYSADTFLLSSIESVCCRGAIEDRLLG